MLKQLLICFAVACGTAQADSTSLQRLGDRTAQLGWEAVGRLELAGNGFCTGTLIERDLVLTAAHCVYDNRAGHLHPADQVLFRAGLRDGQSIAERKGLQIVAHPGYTPGQGLTAQNARHDVALIRLQSPVSTTDADPFVLHGAAPAGSVVSVASYGRGRADAVSRQRQCNLLNSSRDLMLFDCDITFGSSGAPVFAQSGSRGRILSVISGFITRDGTRQAVGMALPARVSELKAMLRRAPVAAPDRRIKRVQIGDGRSGTGAKFIRPGG